MGVTNTLIVEWKPDGSRSNPSFRKLKLKVWSSHLASQTSVRPVAVAPKRKVCTTVKGFGFFPASLQEQKPQNVRTAIRACCASPCKSCSKNRNDSSGLQKSRSLGCPLADRKAQVSALSPQQFLKSHAQRAEAERGNFPLMLKGRPAKERKS